MMKTKLFTLFLALVAGVGTMFAWDYERVQIGDLYYNLDATNQTAEVTYQLNWDENNYKGLTTANIPASVTYNSVSYSVTSIGDFAFYNCSGLTSVTIGNSVTSIGEWAFIGCSGLTSVTIPNSVTSIGGAAFNDCSGLTSVTIPNSVTSIGGVAFNGCSGLTKVNITDIAAWCNIQFESNDSNPLYYAKHLYINDTEVTNLTIPNSVTSIGQYTFYNCSSLTSVTIPNSVTSIGWGAFSGCSGLTSVTIPNSVTSIKSSAFSGCTGLTSVTIPNSVTYIGYNAFSGCTGLISMTVAAGNTKYDSRDNCNAIIETATNTLIQGCNNTVIPNSVTCIGKYAFSDCTGLTSVTIPNSVTSIGNYAFSGCSGLTTIFIGASNPPSLSSTALILCSELNSIFVPCGSLDAYMSTYWSNYSSLIKYQSYTIKTNAQNGNVAISPDEFTICSDITLTATPDYGYHFFQWSDSVTDNPRTIVLIQDTAFTAAFAPNQYTIQDGSDANQGYITGIGSYDYLSEQTITAVNQYGYHFTQWSDGNTDNPRTIVLTQDTSFTAEFAVDKTGVCGHENQLTWLYEDETNTLFISGNGALDEHYTYGLEAPTQTTRLIIEEGVTAIGNSAFVGMCATVTSLSLPGTVTAIGDSAFFGLSSRQFNTLILPNDILSIGNYAFSGAAYMTSIHFGAALEDIGDGAFAGCRRVQKMTCLAEITPNVGDNALTNINSAATLYVPQDYLFEYQIDDNWNRFLLQPLGATGTTTDDSVTVEAHDNNAIFTWPVSDDAATYTIEITKDGEVFCTLIFNANGQLTGIAFAPSRSDDASLAPAAVLTANGWQFTVTGLNNGTNYGYTLDAKNTANTVIASYSGEFVTTGAPIATSLDETGLESAPQKIYRNGQVLILRDGKTYTIQGQEVK